MPDEKNKPKSGRRRQYQARVPVQVYLEPHIVAALDAYCVEHNQSRPQVVTEALLAFLPQQGAQETPVPG